MVAFYMRGPVHLVVLTTLQKEPWNDHWLALGRAHLVCGLGVAGEDILLQE